MSASSTVPSTARHGLSAPDAFTTAGAVVGLGCTLVGQFVQTPWKSDRARWGVDFAGNGGWTTLLVLVAFVVVATMVVGLATDRARAVPPERAARRALVLAVLGAVTIAAFWTGVPAVLAGGAAGLALGTRRELGRLTAPAAVALAVVVLTVASAVYLAFTG